MSLAPSTERETFDTISNLRTVTQRYLDTEKLSARRLTTFHVPVATPRSTRVIAYQHYGTSEDGVLIAQLNNVPNLTFASGDLGILTP